ncbi:MAG: hypothetical protein DRH03_09795 [Deltaproteobacteria bacterium]|nr:MAG: hypothetical protein DRH03_09795 [Deltaproteobacteria bacterium]
MSVNNEWRLVAYKEVVGCLNPFFSVYLGEYCCNCQQVIGRLPEAVEESIDLLDGVYPGCCHRGAGDIFRLEGESCERDCLAPEIVAGLQRERLQKIEKSGSGGGSYSFRRHRDGVQVRGAHCLYFSTQGCLLGDLKGPLCINFICPPMRSDLLYVCGDDDSLVGPECDFLFIYRTLAIISYDDRDEVARELLTLRQRLQLLEDKCRKFLLQRQISGLYEFFN